MCLFAEPGIFSLYVAVSRLTTREGLKILAEGARSIPTNTTTNIVYNEIIHSLQVSCYNIFNWQIILLCHIVFISGSCIELLIQCRLWIFDEAIPTRKQLSWWSQALLSDLLF